MDLAEMPCPNCGYDLRAATMDRCSECGLEIDRAELKESRIPWAHRKKIGRLRAYFATACRITIDSRSIRYELSRPQDPKDSRWFRWTTVALLGVVMGTIAAVAIGLGGVEDLAIQPADSWSRQPEYPGWVQDLAVPWSAGATMRPVLPLSLFVLGFALARAPRTLLRPGRLKAYEEPHRGRAIAVGDYLCAPLSYVVSAGVMIGAFAAGYHAIEGHADQDHLQYAFWLAMLVPEITIVLTVFFVLLRAGQWRARATHRGFFTGLWAVMELIGLWLLAILMCAGFLPWAVGFFWIMIDSYRT